MESVREVEWGGEVVLLEIITTTCINIKELKKGIYIFNIYHTLFCLDQNMIFRIIIKGQGYSH